MINVSEEFKTLVKSNSRKFGAYVDDNDSILLTDADDLKSWSIKANGNLLQTVMRQAEAKYWGGHNLRGSQVNLGLNLFLLDQQEKGTVTFTIANPCVATFVAHGLRTGERVRISTIGALPTGLAEGTDYYVVNIYDEADLQEDVFNLAASYDDAINGVLVATSGSQSGTHTLYTLSGEFSTTTEDIDYGTFIVVEQEENKDTQQTTIKMYDKMYEALRQYELFGQEYPITLKQLLEAICTELGWTLKTEAFLNDDLEITADFFAFQGFTFRDVLNQIAEMTASIIYFDVDDELVVREVPESVSETLTTSELRKLATENAFGAVNSVVLAKTPVERDFVFRGGYVSPPILLEDGEEILMEDGDNLLLEILVEISGLYQIRIENNLIADSDRESYIDSLDGQLSGLTYYPFSANTTFLGYIQVGDKIKVKDRNDVEYDTYVLETELEVGEGVREKLSASIPVKSRTNFKHIAGVITEGVLRTEIGEGNIKDQSVTTAKIKDLSVDKLTTGILNVGVEIIVPDEYNRALIYIANVEDE